MCARAKGRLWVLGIVVLLTGGCATRASFVEVPSPIDSSLRLKQYDATTRRHFWVQAEPLQSEVEANSIRQKLIAGSELFDPDVVVTHRRMYLTQTPSKEETPVIETFEVVSRDGTVKRIKRVDHRS